MQLKYVVRAIFIKANYLRKRFFRKKPLSKQDWEERQMKDELAFWKNPSKFEPLGNYPSVKEKYLSINKKMFNNLRTSFKGGIVCDVGCGPYGGLLPLIHAKHKIGLDPLANAYQQIIKNNEDFIFINSPGEKIPFCNGTLDAVFCVNALDHARDPYQVLREIYRILKRGGYFAFSVDIGGTPQHPHLLLEKDLNKELLDKFAVIQHECSTNIKSSWPDELNIPLYVFQGTKK
ncbi:class I SAM-dependent methyltransferase [Candidatus Peregrinibacteria bacterium]|nr:class I SAM-dependent methyltransferase [Candidatus Peregrinibacteria bacterium]